jgi:hypothetical protein
MSRSYRKHLVAGHSGCRSEKKDKQIANRKLRHRVKLVMKKDVESEVLLPVLREVSDVWCMGKDGKGYYGDFVYSHSRLFPHELLIESDWGKNFFQKLKSK